MASTPDAGNIAAPDTPIEWPHPASLDIIRPRKSPEKFANAPWYHPLGVAYKRLPEYLSGGTFPDNTPYVALATKDWQDHCCAPTSALIMRYLPRERRYQTADEIRTSFVRLIFRRDQRVFTNELVESELELDPWRYRTFPEVPYAAKLGYSFRADSAFDWAEGTVTVEALCFAHPVIPAEFRYVSRKDTSYFGTTFLGWLKGERKARGRFRILLPYHCVEAEAFRSWARAYRYVPLPNEWYHWEIPEGMLVELPWAVTYLGSRLLNGSVRAFVVLYTEWSLLVAATFLWEVYDTRRLFWLSPQLRSAIRSLDLSFWLGGPENYAEVRRLLDVIDAINWPEVTPQNRRRTVPPNPKVSRTERTDEGGDFVWYDPWSRKVITADERSSVARPRVPEGHPIGFVSASSPPDAPDNPDVDMDPADGEEGEGIPANSGDNARDEPGRKPISEFRPAQVSSREKDPFQEPPAETPLSPTLGRARGKAPKSTSSLPLPLGSGIPALDLAKGVRSLASGSTGAKPVSPPVPPSPSSSSLLARDVARMTCKESAGETAEPSTAVVTEDAKVLLLQRLFRSAGTDPKFTSLEGAVAQMVSVLGTRPRRAHEDGEPADSTAKTMRTSEAGSSAGSAPVPKITSPKTAPSGSPRPALRSVRKTPPSNTPDSQETADIPVNAGAAKPKSSRPSGSTSGDIAMGIDAPEADDYEEETSTRGD